MLSSIALCIAFVCATNGELLYTSSSLVYYLPFAVCLMAMAFELLAKQKIVLSSYVLWRAALIALFVVTMLYAISISDAFVALKKYLLQSIVVFLIGIKCTEDPENVNRMIKLCIFAVLVNSIYLYGAMDIAAIAEGERLGVSSVNESWNANQIGLMAALGVLCAVYIGFVCAHKAKGWTRLLSIVLVLFFGYTSILSGSRKSIIIVLATLFIFVLRASKSHRIRNLMLAVILLGAALYAIYNIPFLYDRIGYRFQGLLDMMFAEGGDNSSRIRQNMIQVGMEAFYQKPILGYGLNGFATIYGAFSGKSVYAHNNYIEILVSTGLVGLVVYYAFIVKTLFAKGVPNQQIVFFKAMLCALLIADVGLVSYNDPFVQYILCLVIYGIHYMPGRLQAEHSNEYQEH